MKKQISFVEVLFVCAMASATLSLCSVSLVRSRQSARSIKCSDQFKNLGLAMNDYHNAFQQFPMGSGGTDPGSERNRSIGNAGRLSALVAALPFYEQHVLWEEIVNPHFGPNKFPSMGPVPWFDPRLYPPWGKRPAKLICPSDPKGEAFPLATSYVVCYGDAIERVGSGMSDWPSDDDAESLKIQQAVCRGVFAKQKRLSIADIVDGTSNTIMISEMKIDGEPVAADVKGLASKPSLVITAQEGKDFWPAGRKSVWCDGAIRSSGFQTILPPGSPSATSDHGETTAVMSASSHHGDGASVLMADGSFIFVTSSIDCGDSDAPSVGIQDPGSSVPLAKPGSKSPYGLWGALGTRDNAEPIVDQFEGLKKSKSIQDPIMFHPTVDVPPQTLVAADTKTKLTGWVRARLPDDKISFVDTAYRDTVFSLSDFDGQTVKEITARFETQIVEAREELLPQLEEALGMMKDANVNQFIMFYVDQDEMLQQDIDAYEKELLLNRDKIVEEISELISNVKNSKDRVTVFDNEDGEIDAIFEIKSKTSQTRLSYRAGRWHWTSAGSK
jgi:hypothetical protein